MVSLDEDDLTIETFNEAWSIIISCLPNEVPKDIYQIAFADLVIPPADQLHIHFLYRFKRSVIKGKDIFMPEVQITGEENLTHRSSFFLIGESSCHSNLLNRFTGFELMEQKVHVINSFVDVPMPAKPCNIVGGVFDGVEPFFCTCIHRTLINAGEEHFHRLVLEWAGMGENHIDLVLLKLLFHILLDLGRGLLILPPAVSTSDAIELVHAVCSADGYVANPFEIVYLSILGK